MYFGYVLVSYIIFSSMIFAQNLSKSSANIKVKLIDGMIFKIDKSNLDFNAMVDSSEILLDIKPNDGIILHVSTTKTSSVLISYANIEVYKINNQGEKTNNKKTSEGSPLFQPRIQILSNLANENAIDNNKVSTFYLTDKKRNSSLDLRIGGVLSLPNPSLEGIYSGKFVLSLVHH